MVNLQLVVLSHRGTEPRLKVDMELTATHSVCNVLFAVFKQYSDELFGNSKHRVECKSAECRSEHLSAQRLAAASECCVCDRPLQVGDECLVCASQHAMCLLCALHTHLRLWVRFDAIAHNFLLSWRKRKHALTSLHSNARLCQVEESDSVESHSRCDDSQSGICHTSHGPFGGGMGPSLKRRKQLDTGSGVQSALFQADSSSSSPVVVASTRSVASGLPSTTCVKDIEYSFVTDPITGVSRDGIPQTMHSSMENSDWESAENVASRRSGQKHCNSLFPFDMWERSLSQLLSSEYSEESGQKLVVEVEVAQELNHLRKPRWFKTEREQKHLLDAWKRDGKKMTFAALDAGDFVCAQDSVSQWYWAVVYAKRGSRRVLVHFMGFGPQFDERVVGFSKKLGPVDLDKDATLSIHPLFERRRIRDEGPIAFRLLHKTNVETESEAKRSSLMLRSATHLRVRFNGIAVSGHLPLVSPASIDRVESGRDATHASAVSDLEETSTATQRRRPDSETERNNGDSDGDSVVPIIRIGAAKRSLSQMQADDSSAAEEKDNAVVGVSRSRQPVEVKEDTASAVAAEHSAVSGVSAMSSSAMQFKVDNVSDSSTQKRRLQSLDSGVSLAESVDELLKAAKRVDAKVAEETQKLEAMELELQKKEVEFEAFRLSLVEERKKVKRQRRNVKKVEGKIAIAHSGVQNALEEISLRRRH